MSPSPERAAHIVLGNPEGTLLEEVADKRMKRRDLAMSYALALRTPEEVDWSRVNAAILGRWSVAGLKWIKTHAWRLHEGKTADEGGHS